MKRLNTREEIGRALGFGNYPVLTIDLADSDSHGLKGCRIRIDAGKFRTGERHLVSAELRVYRDEKKLTVSAGCVGLSSSFGYKDLLERTLDAQSPIISKDQDVVIVILDSRFRKLYAPLLVKTSSYISPYSSQPIGFEDVDMTPYLLAAGCELNDPV